MGRRRPCGVDLEGMTQQSKDGIQGNRTGPYGRSLLGGRLIFVEKRLEDREDERQECLVRSAIAKTWV